MRSAPEWLALLKENVSYQAGDLYWIRPARGRSLDMPIGTRVGRHGEIFLAGEALGTHRAAWRDAQLPALLGEFLPKVNARRIDKEQPDEEAR